MSTLDEPDSLPLVSARCKLGTLRPQAGRKLRLSAPRRFVCDLLAAARHVPRVPMQRRMRLADVMAARNARAEHICWSAIFMKAYAQASAERPELRRSYMKFPWPYLYEHAATVVNFSLERVYQGEEAVFFAQIPQPELLSLPELDALVWHYKTARLERLRSFRRAMRLSRWPRPIRRLLWWLALNVNGAYRTWLFGTSGMSIVASFGAAGLYILSPVTTTLNYGTFESDGSLDVRLTYDHRVLDGAQVARAMAAMEENLHGPIREELLALAAAGNSNGAPTRSLRALEVTAAASANGDG